MIASSRGSSPLQLGYGLAFLLPLFLGAHGPAEAAGSGSKAESAYQVLLEQVAEDRSVAVALDDFLATGAGSRWEIPARIVAAEMAFRRGRVDFAYQTLASIADRTGDDYFGAYAEYVLGLVGPEEEAHRHFTAAFERSENTLLQHRAGLWLADEVRRRRDQEGALRLLESLSLSPIGRDLDADLTVRRALLLDTLGRGDQAEALLLRLWIEEPDLAYRKETKSLFELVVQRLATSITELDGPRRAARIERLLDTGHARRALPEARKLLGSKGIDRNHTRYLLARAERRGGSTRRAVAQLERIPSTSAVSPRARLLRATALRRLGQKRKGEAALAKLAADADAGDVRFDAAKTLAAIWQDRRPAAALALWQTIARESPPSLTADAGIWAYAWHLYESGDNAEAASWFGRLISQSPEPVHVARGAYWAARSLERLGRDDESRVLYLQARRSDRLGYYGLTASRRLRQLDGADPDSHPTLGADATPVDPLQDSPREVLRALVPAQDLLLLGLFEDAIAEIEYQCRRFPGEPAPRALLADVYHAHGDYQASVGWVKQAFPDLTRGGLPQPYWSRLYPLAYWDTIQQQASKQGVDPYFVAAVLYQESRFQAHARSSADARGLMQIMPATGRGIARQLRERGFQVQQLFEPKRNIRYGLHYLKNLLEQHDGSTVRALAAYNAGPGRVKRWSKKGTSEMDEFVERIPFRETRLYVKKILVAHEGYHQVYDGRINCDLRH